MTLSLEKQVRRMKGMLKAYALFEAAVMDGVMPEIAQADLIAAIEKL